MKKLTFYLFGLLLPVFLPAQEPLQLSLEEAQSLAIANARNYQGQLLEQQITEAQLRETKTRLFPQVSLSFDIRYYVQQPTTILPNEVVGIPGDEGVPVQFGTRWNNLANIEFEQFIYDGQLLEDMKINKLNQQVDAASAAVTAADVKLEAIRRYYAVLVARAQMSELEASAARQRNTIESLQPRVQAGRLPAIELERARTDYEVTLGEITKARYTVGLNEALLRRELLLPDGQPFVLTDTLTSPPPLPAVPLSLRDDTLAFQNLPEYQLQALRLAVVEEEIKKQQKVALPTVSLYGLMGAQALGNRLNYFNTGVFPWYGQVYLGIRTSWNVNRLFDNKHALPQLEFKKRQASLNLAQENDDLSTSLLQARTDLLRAWEDLRIHERRREFATSDRDYQATRLKGELATVKDLNEAERSLLYAQAGYLTAYYQYLTAYYEWQKALGTL